MEAKAAPPDRLELTDARDAVTALYEAHALGLIRLAVVMLGDRPAAEDVVQEAFCGLYRRWHALSDTTNALQPVIRRGAGDRDRGGSEHCAPPAGHTVRAVTAAADDRTFMLDTQPFDNPNSPNNQNFEPRTFLELRLSPGGDVVSMNRIAVSVPRGQLMTGFALSPDGRRLAIAVQPDNNKRDLALTEVKVITLLDLDTGGGSLMADSREAVSLVSQDSIGATPLPSANPSDVGQNTVTISAPAGGTASPTASPTRQAVRQPVCQLDSIVTPDGSAFVCGAIAFTGTPRGRSRRPGSSSTPRRAGRWPGSSGTGRSVRRCRRSMCCGPTRQAACSSA